MYKCATLFENIYKNDVSYFHNIILPKIEKKENPLVFFTLTYLTPNYLTLAMIEKLKRLTDDGFKIILVIWDTNAIIQKHALDLLKNYSSEEEFLVSKETELINVLISVGISPEKVIVNRSSKIWKKLASMKNPQLFLQFYNLLMNLDINIVGKFKSVSYLIQLPLDMFVASNYHILFPEHIQNPIDLFFFDERKEDIYVHVRDKMYSLGMIFYLRPALLKTESLPQFMYNGLIPEWNMNYDELHYILANCDFKKSDAIAVIEGIGSKLFDELEVVQNNIVKKYDSAKVAQLLSTLSKNDLITNLANFLNLYLHSFKKKFIINDVFCNNFEIDSKDDMINIGGILRSEILLNTLFLCDGSNTVTNIAKKLEKQIGNISNGLTILQKNNLIKKNAQGFWIRNTNSIIINFE